MVEVYLLNSGQYEEVTSLYRCVGYAGTVAPSDLVVGAYELSQLVGAVRLVRENDSLVLRGMHVRKAFQRQGIGLCMLAELQKYFSGRECWCIPYSHLRSLYSRAGFMETISDGAPEFLAERLKAYTEAGLHVVLMKRNSDYCV